MELNLDEAGLRLDEEGVEQVAVGDGVGGDGGLGVQVLGGGEEEEEGRR